ncbi:MAG TPA: uroporphyrinogen-III C-methyltransferase [Deltaproteobacteria bacterium]|nr:uroporphyrinogen-III C-methyltransferase [Deltaproteobacteria bacterium]
MKVYLIGAGPGDPDLITVKAMHALAGCDAVVYDDLIPTEILMFAPTSAQKIYVGKRAGRDYMKQPEINDLLVSLANKGLTIARLKGGDPCIFGRGGEEALHLSEHGIPFEIIPGISSAVAGPISAGIPPTHRGYASSVKFVTAHEDPTKESGFLDWANLAHDSGTIIFLMGARRIASIAEKLMAEGMTGEMPCALVQDATLPSQRHVISTLQAVGEAALHHRISSPCIMVVGKVAELSSALYTKHDLPLSGKNILITRPAHLALKSASLFASQGVRCVIYPLVDISPLEFSLPDISTYDMFIFTSQNAVPLFFDKIFSSGLDARVFSGKEIVCIGPKTRDALTSYGIVADAMARDFRAEGIMEILKDKDLSGKRICLPRAQGARAYLREALEEKGAVADEIFVYETILPPEANRQDFLQALEKVQTVIFTSPSGFRHAASLLDGDTSILQNKELIAIGPVTSTAMERAGLSPHLVAQEYTDEGIISVLKGEEH